VLIGSFATGVATPVINEFLIANAVEGMWKPALERRPNFQWPKDAYLLTSRDADPDVDTWMAQNWVADPVADPGFIREIIPETSGTRLGTWIGTLRVLAVLDNRERLKRLAVPTLVIWATQDNAFPETPDQTGLRASLDAAVEACRTSYFFKTYGKRPLPASGVQESDLGHNTQWGAPEAVATDIAAFIFTGAPARDWPYADPSDVSKVLIDKEAAPIIERRPPADCTPPRN